MKSKSSRLAQPQHKSAESEDILSLIKSAKHAINWRDFKKNSNLSSIKSPQNKHPGTQIIKSPKDELPDLGKYLINLNTSDVSYLKDAMKPPKTALQPIIIFPTDIKHLEKFLEGMDKSESPNLHTNHLLINQSLCKKEGCLDHLRIKNLSDENLRRGFRNPTIVSERSVEFLERYDLGSPSGRQEVSNLKNWLDLMRSKYLKNSDLLDENELEELKSGELIYTICKRELIRQVSVYCVERGELLEEIFKGFDYIYKQREKIKENLFDNLKEKTKFEQYDKEKHLNLQLKDLTLQVQALNEKLEVTKNKKKGLKKELSLMSKEYEDYKANSDKNTEEWKKIERKLRKEIEKLKDIYLENAQDRLKFENSKTELNKPNESTLEKESTLTNNNLRLFVGNGIMNVSKTYRFSRSVKQGVDIDTQTDIPDPPKEVVVVPEPKPLVEPQKSPDAPKIVKKKTKKPILRNRFTQTDFRENSIKKIKTEEISETTSSEVPLITNSEIPLMQNNEEIIELQNPAEISSSINENNVEVNTQEIISDKIEEDQDSPIIIPRIVRQGTSQVQLLNPNSMITKEKKQKILRARKSVMLSASPLALNNVEAGQNSQPISQRNKKNSKILPKKQDDSGELQSKRESDRKKNSIKGDDSNREIAEKSLNIEATEKIELEKQKSEILSNANKELNIEEKGVKLPRDRKVKRKRETVSPSKKDSTYLDTQNSDYEESLDPETPIHASNEAQQDEKEKATFGNNKKKYKKNSLNKSKQEELQAKLEKSSSNILSQIPQTSIEIPDTPTELQNPNFSPNGKLRAVDLARSYSITSFNELEEENVSIVKIIPPDADAPSWTLGYQAGYEVGKREGFRDGEAFGIEEGQMNAYIKASREYANSSRNSQLDISDEEYWETDNQSDSDEDYKETKVSEENNTEESERNNKEKYRKRVKSIKKSEIRKKETGELEELQENETEEFEDEEMSFNSEKFTIESEDEEDYDEIKLDKDMNKEEKEGNIKLNDEKYKYGHRDSIEKPKVREVTKFAEFHFHKRETKRIDKKIHSSASLLKKFLSRSMKWILRRATMSRRMVNKIVSSFYASSLSHKLSNSYSVLDYLYNDMLEKYTLKKITDRKFIEFIASLLRSSDSRRALIFLKLTGLSDKINMKGYSMYTFQFYLKALSFMQKAKIGINSSFDETADLIYMPTLRAVECIKERLDGIVDKTVINKLISQVEQASIQDPLKINTGLVEQEYVLELMMELYEEYQGKILKGIDEAVSAIKYNEDASHMSKGEFMLLARHISPAKFFAMQKDDAGLNMKNSMAIKEFTGKCIEKGVLSINDIKLYCQINDESTKEEILEEIKASFADMKNIVESIDCIEEKHILHKEEWEKKLANCESGAGERDTKLTKLALKLYHDELLRLKLLIKEA